MCDRTGLLAWFPRIDSQDAWVWRASSQRASVVAAGLGAAGLDAELGRPRCDNRIAAMLHDELGYAVLNPSLDVVVRHLHEEQRRLYTDADNVAGRMQFVPLTLEYV